MSDKTPASRMDTTTKVLFLHGKESGPGGTKPTFLVENGYTVINPALPAEDFEAALRIAQAAFDEHAPAVVVGSSRGGAVAMNIRSGNVGMVLLAPAWKKWGKASSVIRRVSS
jgi:pimeloyl-ACP methyl ester carboxylesterase